MINAAGSSFTPHGGGPGGAGAGTQIAPPSFGETCGSLRYFSGGGGGSGPSAKGCGGLGGGGDGNPGVATPGAANGTANTGGGSGAQSNGGSGIVVIRYKYK